MSSHHSNHSARVKYRSAYVRAAAVALGATITAFLTIAPALLSQETQLPERRLPARPLARWTEPMSEIAGVRELSDGRVIVLDSREQRLVLVDLDAGTSRPIGQKGKGPGEYSRALRLVAVPGDSTFVVDGENRRILVIGADGAPNGVLTSFGAPADAQGLGTSALRDADVVYGAYFQGRGPPTKDGDFVAPDSLPIFRVDLVTGRIDSMASFAVPRSKITIAREGQKITAINIVRPPFSVGDEWTVGDDGRVAIARRSPYRVDLVSRDLRVVRGDPVPAKERRVEATDRAEYLAQRADGASLDPATVDWPERMPLFLPGAVIAVPNGETWVRRTAAASAATTRHDVFDAIGERVAEVLTPTSLRIVLVTARGVYVTRTDDDGLQYLERFAMPR